MKKLTVMFVGVLIAFSACENKIENQIKGVWVIDELKYDHIDAQKYFYSNALIIKDDTCFVPIHDVNQSHTNKKYGIWSVYKKNKKNYFKIETANTFFNDTYEVTKIWKDCNDHGCLMKMTLQCNPS